MAESQALQHDKESDDQASVEHIIQHNVCIESANESDTNANIVMSSDNANEDDHHKVITKSDNSFPKEHNGVPAENRADQVVQPTESLTNEGFVVGYSGRASRPRDWRHHFLETSYHQDPSSSAEIRNTKAKPIEHGFLVKPHHYDVAEFLPRILFL